MKLRSVNQLTYNLNAKCLDYVFDLVSAHHADLSDFTKVDIFSDNLLPLVLLVKGV